MGIVIFLLLVVLFIRSPWGQGIIVDKLISHITEQTDTEVQIDKLFVTFDGDILLKGLYLEDKQGDTLIYSKSLEADVPLWPIIQGNGIGVEAIDWTGVRANISRQDTVSGYNFQFLLDVFSRTDSTATATAQDSTAAPLNLILGNLSLEDFNVTYNDAVLGIDSHFIVGSAYLEMETTNLEAMHFTAADVMVANSIIRYEQSPVPPQPDADPVPLPLLAAENLKLQNVIIEYGDTAAGLMAHLDITDMYAEVPKLDLQNNEFIINDFGLTESDIDIAVTTREDSGNVTANGPSGQSQNTIWPDIELLLEEIVISETSISYRLDGAQVNKGTFNPNALAFENINLEAREVVLTDQRAEAHLGNFQATELSGINIHNLNFHFNLNNENLMLPNLEASVNENRLRATISMEYPSLQKFMENPEIASVDATVPSFYFNTSEIFRFQPQLRQNKYMAALARKGLSGSFEASGVLSNIAIPSVNARWGTDTRVSASGSLQNATNVEEIQFSFPRVAVVTEREDIRAFIDEEALGIKLPQTVSLNGALTGNLNAMDVDASLTTSQGIVAINGVFENNEQLAFNATIEIEEYRLSELLQNDQLGTFSLSLTTEGQGSTINSLDAQVEATVSSFQFNDYQISDLKIEGRVEDGEGVVFSDYKDTNINAELTAEIELDSVSPRATIDLNLIGADLQALGLMQRDVKTGFKLNAEFEGNLENFDVIATVGDGVFVYDNKSYLLGEVLTTAHIRKDTTSIWLDNKVVQLKLESNSNPQTFANALQTHVSSYFYRDVTVADSLASPVIVDLDAKISQAPILNEVFLVNVRDLDTIDIAVDFNQRERKLDADIYAPHINYSGNELDSLAFTMNTNENAFNFNLRFNSIEAGPLALPRTEISGNQVNNELSLNFTAYGETEKMINIQSQITGSRDRLRFHVLPENLLLNYQPWQTPGDNEVIITNTNLDFNNFLFRRNNQSVVFKDDIASVSKPHVAINFENFELSEFLSYLNPQDTLATGNLNGQLRIEKPFGNTGLVANITVRELGAMNVDLGMLTLQAEPQGGSRYDFDMAIKEGAVDLDISGDYKAQQQQALLDLNLDINRFDMAALEGFSMGAISNGSGSFSGEFSVDGTVAQPQYDGTLRFADAGFEITQLNAPFQLVNEQLEIDNAGISMDGFTIRDAEGNTLSMSGFVGTEDFLNPTFDLQLNATDFTVLDATEEDNDLFYGTASFDATATVTGDLQIPIIDMQFTVSEDTDITYILPSATVNIEEREGVVMFVNRENPDAILTRNTEEAAVFTGFDISALIQINDGASVKLILDEQTGDNFLVQGEGDLNFTMNPNGRMNLTGVYNVSDGHYEMNLYNLVSRRFRLTEGSKVSWSGDPLDASLDIRAVYDVEASASPLMAAQTSGADPSTRSRFRQVLPFYVYLNVDGELTRPEISFNLDMPEDEQGAIGGQVYGQVQQLNQQEALLNKQVFSLLVLNRFYPEPGSDGSRGGVATIARDNLNDVLSDQLNVFSQKLLGDSGVELDFGLDSYTDYQGDSPQERTQLDIAAQKKLFDDRLVVSVGSAVDLQGTSPEGEATPLIGNVSIEYLLTENGQFRLRGFRKSEFENVIDGQTIVSGIALIFTQEFNKFNELWDALLRRETEETQQSANKKDSSCESDGSKNSSSEVKKNRTDKSDNP
ncbi:MAG: hypothetical protein CMC08_06235 [Flavobacteriaceae bacterium]|nr:hypothetical protein [Flavobacteriaceae bacterium]